MVVFNGSHDRSSAQTTYGFEPSHVFAIHDPDEVLYECVGFNGTDLIARPVETPVLQQSFGQNEIRKLVAEGKIEPRTRENEEHNKPRIANAPQKLAAIDLPEDEKAELLFYYELCYRIMRMREDGETSLSEGPLRLAIAQVWAQLVSGVSETEPDRKHSRPGRRPKFKVLKEHKIGARKEKVSFGVPAPSTVKGWIRALNENQWDLLALRDHRKGRVGSRSPRISDPKATALMHSWVREYLDSSRPTMATLYKLMRGSVELEEENARREKDCKLALRPKDFPSFAAVNVQRADEGLPPLPIPSQSTFERAIRKLGKYEVMAAREGPGKARRKFRVVGRARTTLLPGQRVLLDCWKVQLMGLKLPHEFWDGLDEDLAGKLGTVRLTLCVAIDEATRVILGARLSVNANADTAFRTLEMVCQDKTEIARAADCRSDWAHACTPRTVAVDSGPEFIDARVKCAVGDIGSSYEVGRAKHPDARGVVERFFETMDLQQLQFFQGRTFSGISDKGDYDPVAVANVLAEDLGRHLVRYIVDTYHNTAHSGLSWQTPNEAWEDLSSRYVVKPPPGRIRRQLVFGFSDNRRIQNRGVRFMGLFYRSAELSRLRMDVGQDDVRVRVDLEDLGAVFVSENIPHAPWFRVPCDFEFMNGVSAAHWYEAASALRRKYKAGAKLAEAIVIASLQDVRQAGRHSAAQRGIGPSTVTREEIERQETEIVSHYNFRIAQERGQALAGMDEEPGVEAATEDSFVGDTSDPGASVEAVEDAENESPPEPRMERRRGRFRKDFLGED